jgi:hypothetical protein
MKSDIYNHILIELSFTELGLVKDNTWNWEQGRNMGLEYATFYFDIGVTLSVPDPCSTRFMVCSDHMLHSYIKSHCRPTIFPLY